MSKKRPKKAPSSRPASSRPRPGTTAPTPGWDEVLASLAKRSDPEATPPSAVARNRPVEPAEDRTGARVARRQSVEDHPGAEPIRKGSPPPAPAGGCAGALAEMEPQIVAASYWIDTASWTGPTDITVRFSGKQLATDHGVAETFDRVEEITGIVPDTGRIAVTTRQEVAAAGRWQVTARPVPPKKGKDSGPADTGRAKLPPASTAVVGTKFGALAQGPGVHVFAWPALIACGALLAIMIQAILLVRAGLPLWGAVLTDLAACAVGILGARLWFLALHLLPLRGLLKAGACIQGFLVGAFATMIIGALAQHLPPGALFDAAAPGLFLGMAVGRPGCFFTGCCYGRPTPTRWGLWSSDRSTLRRRHPVQLYEAAAALLIGTVSLTAVIVSPPESSRGAVFIVAVMAYTIARQLLFPLRTDPHTPKGRTLTIAACSLVILVAVAASLLS